MKQENATTSIENNEPDSDNDAKILDFVEDIEFPDDIKPKLLVKEEVLKSECSGIDQKPNMVDPIMPNDRKICKRYPTTPFTFRHGDSSQIEIVFSQ